MDFRSTLNAVCFAFVLAASSTACLAKEASGGIVGDSAEAAPADAEALFERLGGNAKVTAVVGDAVERLASDRRTRRAFENANLGSVKEKLVEQICWITAGGCDGADAMSQIEGGNPISSAEFYRFVETLRESMRSYDVPLSARNELLSVLSSHKAAFIAR